MIESETRYYTHIYLLRKKLYRYDSKRFLRMSRKTYTRNNEFNEYGKIYLKKHYI